MAATTNMAATTKTFDHTYDVVVVGSGAAAMATALGAVDEGLSVLMVESTPKWGGNTAMSGGGLWLPNNPLMQADRAGDSREEALAYMEATIGESGRASTRERKEAFVDGVADLVDTAAKHGLKWARAKDYADYYPEKPGGKIGRGLEVEPFDLKAIGDWWESCQAPAAMPIKTDDVWLLGRAWSTPGGMVRGAQLVGRVAAGLAKGKKLAGIGAGFASAMLEAMTAVCSVGLDMVMVPGDTSAETLSGILADEMAIGMINSKTTAVRIIPVPGKGPGEWVDYGGLLGSAPIIPVNRFSSAAFVRRGGRIPAPLQSFNN